MKKKFTFIFFIAFFFFLENVHSKMMPQTAQSSHLTNTISKTNNKKFKKFKTFKSLRKLIKRQKYQPPNDDLWVLQLIFLVAFCGIVTFALSAIMLAIHGLSSLWITLMIVGGIIGVLPMLLIGAFLLFR